MMQTPHSPTTARFISYHAQMDVKVAIEFDKGTITYAQLEKDIYRASQYLAQLSLIKSNSLVVGLDDPYEHLIFVLATELMGAFSTSIQMTEDPFPLALMSSVNLVISTLEFSSPGVNHHRLSPNWRDQTKVSVGVPNYELGDTDPVRMIRSSGTTGTPKKIMILRARQAQWLSYLANSAGYSSQTRFYVAAPFSVNTFYMRAVLCLRLGGSLVMGDLLMLRHATHTWMLPATIEQVMKTLPSDFVKPPKLEISTAGAPLMSAMRDRVLSRLATSIVNTYGTNEVGPICVMTADGRGIVVPCTEVQVVNDVDQEVPRGELGQLRVRNQIMADDYVDNPSASRERFKQGWFYPGDEVVMSSVNEIRLLGRADDMLNLAGYKQRPEELEDVVKGVKGVADAAFLTHNANDGSVQLCLALVLESPSAKDDVIREIKKVLRVPVNNIVITLLSTLPRTNTGKIRRNELLPFFKVHTDDR